MQTEYSLLPVLENVERGFSNMQTEYSLLPVLENVAFSNMQTEYVIDIYILFVMYW